MKLFARAPRFRSTRIFALGRGDRSFYLLSSPHLPLSHVCIAEREPVGIRTGSTDLGPRLLFFFFSSLGRGSAEEEYLRFSRNRPRVSSSSSPSPSPPSFSSRRFCPSAFLLFAFLFVPSSPPPPLPSCPALLPISALFPRSSPYLFDRYPVPSITFTSFYRPPVLRNGYVYTGCPVVR